MHVTKTGGTSPLPLAVPEGDASPRRRNSSETLLMPDTPRAGKAKQSMENAKKNGDVEANAPMIEKNKQEGISSAGYKVLLLLAVQNCVKNLVTRVAVQGDAHFLYSAAVLATEGTKCTASLLYIFLVERGTPTGVIRYLRAEWKKFLLLMAVWKSTSGSGTSRRWRGGRRDDSHTG